MTEKFNARVAIAMGISLLLLLSTAPVLSPEAEAAPDTGIHDLKNFTIEAEVATDGAGNSLNDNGQVTYNVTIQGQIPADVYPYVYPINVTYTDRKSDKVLGSETIYLSPTKTPGFVPNAVNESSRNVPPRTMQRQYQVTLAFNSLFNRSVTAEKTVNFSAKSRLSPESASTNVTAPVNGPLPSGVSNGFVETRVGLDEPSSVTFVDTYRISKSPQSTEFQESGNLPEISGHNYAGTIESFSSMSSPRKGAAKLVAGTGKFNMLTLTRSIQSAQPQTVIITYEIQSNGPIRVTPVNSDGEPINEEANFTLPKDPGARDNCRALTDSPGNMCVLTLSESTVSQVNRLGELLLHYEGPTGLSAAIYCQSVVTGYMTSTTETCGNVNTFESAQLVSFKKFTGNVSEDQTRDNYSSPSVEFDVQEISYPTDLEMRIVPNVTGQPQGYDLYYKVYSENDIDENGDVTGSPVKQGHFTYDGSSPDPEPQKIEFSVSGEETDFNDGSERFIAVLCETSSGCNVTSNEVKRTLTFETNEEPSIPVLVPDEPETVELPLDSTREITVGLRTFETTDSNYEVGRPEWNCIAGPDCPQDSRDTSFTGTIRQTVFVNSISGSKINDVRSGQLIPEAQSKRSDIEGGTWVDREQSIINAETEYAYTTTSTGAPGPNWEPSSDSIDRTVQVGTTRSFLEVKDGSGFSSIVTSEASWYPLRGNKGATNPPTSSAITETRIRHVDPDRCLNCLPTENVSEARARLNNTTGATLLQSYNGANSWRRVSDEPAAIYDRREDKIVYNKSGADIGISSMIYENFTATDTARYLNREGKTDKRRLYKWVYTSGADKAQFERPVYEGANEYRKTIADARYQFTGRVDSPRTLYKYGKEITETIKEYSGKIVWYDISQSYAEQGELDGFQVLFQGADVRFPANGIVTWNPSIHGTAPEDITDQQVENFCDSTSTVNGLNRQVITDDDISGAGGEVVYETCQVDGQERIVRVGKRFFEPAAEPYTATFYLQAGNNVDSAPGYDVNVIGRDNFGSNSENPEAPEISDVTAINNRTDYNIGTVAINGTISSGTERLPERYRITVNPADDIDTVSGCKQLSNYQGNSSKQIVEETVSGDTIREFLNCEMIGFYKYDLVPSEFTQYNKTYYSDGTTSIDQKEIPKGAIQECRSPLQFSTNLPPDCIAKDDAFQYLNTSQDVNFGGRYDPSTSGGLQAVDPGKLGRTCPKNYERTIESSQVLSPLIDRNVSYKCILVSEPKFTLQTRQVTVEYENVRAGVVQSCSRIPVTQEGGDGTHQGYRDISDSSKENEICKKVDSTDPGPSEFTLAEEVVVDGETRPEYKQVPAGAFRGRQLTGNKVPPECASTSIRDDGALICEFKKPSGETVSVRYGTVVNGSWVSSSDTITEIKDQEEATKTVWRGDFIVNGSENFTTTINPRQTIYDAKSGTVEFYVELRDSDGTVLQNKTVQVRLCSAEQVQRLPKSGPTTNECKRFDTMLNGYNETLKFDRYNTGPPLDDPYSIRDAMNLSNLLSRYSGFLVGSVNVTIQTAAQDACPYTREYPRKNGQLIDAVDNFGDPGPFTYEITASTTREELVRKVRQNLSAFYSSSGNVCESSDSPVKLPSRQTDSRKTITFGKESFVNSETREFIRYAGLEDLKHHTQNPVQSQWGESKLGGALRLGTPVLGPDETHENLSALYPFDHDPTIDYTPTDFGGSYPNHYVVQDVYNHEMNTSTINGNENSQLNPEDHGVHQARLWYGTPCNTGDPKDGDLNQQRLSSPQSLDYRGFYSVKCPSANIYDPEAPLGGLQVTRNNTKFNKTYVTNSIFSNSDISTRIGFSRRENQLGNQSAFMYVPPTTRGYNYMDGRSGPVDATKFIEDNYAEGLFGTNALKLDTTSWLMLSPPCMSTSKVRQGVLAKNNLYECSGPFSTSDRYRGGFLNAYDKLDTNAPKQEYSYNYDIGPLSDGGNSGYSITFWVSDGEDGGSDASYPKHPYSTIVSIGLPATGYQESVGSGQANIHSTTQLSPIRKPEKIDVSDLGGQFLGQQYVEKSSNWMYGEHVSLKNTFEHCLATDPGDSGRPVLCDVYNQATGDEVSLPNSIFIGGVKDYRDEEGYDRQYEDWYNVIENRIEWKFVYDWAVEAHTALRDADNGGEPLFEKPTTNENEVNQVKCSVSDNDALRNDVLYEGEGCSNDSTYMFSNIGARGTTPNNYRDSSWTHVTISYNPSAINNPNRGSVSVYINGRYAGGAPLGVQDCTSNGGGIFSGECGGSGIHSDGETFDTGRFYEDSVISIGGLYQSAGYTTDPNNWGQKNKGHYRPMLRASRGDIYIDELRVYDTAIPPKVVPNSEIVVRKDPLASTIPTKSNPGELPTDEAVYKGTITTKKLTEGIEGTSVPNEFQNSKQMDVSVDVSGAGAYNIEIIPCSGGSCYVGASATINDSSIYKEYSGGLGEPTIATAKQRELSDKEKRIAFDADVLRSQGVTSIDSIRMEVTLGTINMNQTPVINSIEVKPIPSPYKNCQDVMEEYKSFEGNPDVNVKISGTIGGESGVINCDFEKGEGGWTRFAWFEEGRYNRTTFEDSLPLMQSRSVTDCPVNASSCFATPNYFVPSNINFSEYKYADSREDFNAQLMIKAVNESGQTVDWAAFEMAPYGNIRNGGNLQDFSAEDPQSWVRDLKNDTQFGKDTDRHSSTLGLGIADPLYHGIKLSNTTTSGPGDTGRIENCMYTIAHGQEHDSRCITHYYHTTFSDGTARFKIIQGKIKDTTFGGKYISPTYTHLEVVRDNSENRIESVTCLGRDVARCELYYKTGSIYNNSDVNSESTAETTTSSTNQSTSSNTIDNTPSHYWSADTINNGEVPDRQGSMPLQVQRPSNFAVVDGHDGTSSEAIRLKKPSSGDNIGLNTGSKKPIPRESSFTISGWFTTNASGDIISAEGGGSNEWAISGFVDGQDESISITMYYHRASRTDCSVTAGSCEVVQLGGPTSNIDSWNHFTYAVNMSSSRAVLYVNGQRQDSADLRLNNPKLKDYGYLSVGYSSVDCSTYTFGGCPYSYENGVFEELMVFDSELNATEAEIISERGYRYKNQ